MTEQRGMRVRVTKRVDYTLPGDAAAGREHILPPGEYEVEHFSPWGPSVYWEGNNLVPATPSVIVPWACLEDGKPGIRVRLDAGERAIDRWQRPQGAPAEGGTG